MFQEPARRVRQGWTSVPEGGVADPYADAHPPRRCPMQLSAGQVEELVRRNGHVKSVDFDPVTRIAGALALHTVADLKERRVLEARSMATLFRGYEVIMIGRDPRRHLHHQPRLRRVRRRPFDLLGAGHRDGHRVPAAQAGIAIRNLALALEFPVRPPVASAPAGRPGLFGRHDWSDQPRAPRGPGRRNRSTSMSTATGTSAI